MNSILVTPAAFIKSFLKKAVAACTKPGSVCQSSDRPATLHFFTIAVLVDDRGPYNPTLEQLAYDISEGPCIGEFSHLGSRRLTKKETHAALLAIGNDGSFFSER